MDERDAPMDGEPGRVYRSAARDEPPASIDAAVVAAARASVAPRAARRWGAPVALAAVLVLAVGVTLRVADERPDAQDAGSAPRTSGSAPYTAESEPPALDRTQQAPTQMRKESRQAQPAGPALPLQPKARPPSEPREAHTSPRQRDGRADAPAAARAPVADSSAVPATVAENSAPAMVPDTPVQSAARPSARLADRANVPAEQQSSLAVRPAPEAARAPAKPERAASAAAGAAGPAAQSDSSAPMMAKEAAAEAGPAANVRTPEEWLERIAELRSRGRHKEADESLAEFRRRYPGYAIAPETLRRIAPPR